MTGEVQVIIEVERWTTGGGIVGWERPGVFHGFK